MEVAVLEAVVLLEEDLEAVEVEAGNELYIFIGILKWQRQKYFL